MNTQQLSRLMRVSWEIQRRRKINRSKALILAWSIFFNADILVYYLHTKHSSRNSTKAPANSLQLF